MFQSRIRLSLIGFLVLVGLVVTASATPSSAFLPRQQPINLSSRPIRLRLDSGRDSKDNNKRHGTTPTPTSANLGNLDFFDFNNGSGKKVQIQENISHGEIPQIEQRRDSILDGRDVKIAVVSWALMTTLLLASPSPVWAKGGPSGGGGGSSSSSSSYERSSFEDKFDQAVLTGFFTLAAGVTAQTSARNSRFDKKFEACQNGDDVGTATTTPTQVKPWNGVYVGSADDQSVSTRLNFLSDGKMSGTGEDSRDGRYSVKGEWCKGMAKWEETYSDPAAKNLKVTVRALLKSEDLIVAIFAANYDGGSSYGEFRLKPKR